jgi:esterase/lipase superfamily enzyme
MTRWKRILLIAAAVVAIAAALFVALFQEPTRVALERAEALQFRRMLVTRQGEDGDFRFFFVTNRNLDDGDGPLEERFTNERGSDLNFGIFDTSIEPSLGIGMLVNPTDWFQNEEIQVRRILSLDTATAVEELRLQVEASPYRSLLININGFRERFPSALRKTAFLAHVLDINSPMLVFDWPGDQGSSPRGYHRAQGIARESGQDLARTIDAIIREVQPERLWIVANSMGGEVVVSALSELYQNAEMADPQTEIEHVVLTAPDVSHAEFGSTFKPKIMALSENLTIYVSSNDRALLMSRVLNRGRRLGESTVDTSNPDQFEEATAAFDLVDTNNDRVSLIDITPVNRTRNFHNFSLETPEFFDDLYLRLSNANTPRSRLQYRVITASGKEYWVLTRGR